MTDRTERYDLPGEPTERYSLASGTLRSRSDGWPEQPRSPRPRRPSGWAIRGWKDLGEFFLALASFALFVLLACLAGMVVAAIVRGALR